ncbi:hypothetical protein SAMN04488243_1186 [Thermus arciformis]|uniref:PIN domain-containing protein n=2 Tax=Thermus arciformis TaxID=482827 RepID=A0A1G7H856_9DEIN|nr:hypothetical protein [Thermus arciformis]SDE96565.1 hypothetical protein SAMN04488243_1186 [Thermus arciformis]
MGILAEIAYLAERRLSLGALEAFLQDLEAGAFSLECGEEDLPRVRALVARYRALPLGFADAAVVAVSTPPRRKPRWGPQKDLPKPYFGRPMLRNQRAAT